MSNSIIKSFDRICFLKSEKAKFWQFQHYATSRKMPQREQIRAEVLKVTQKL